MIHTRQRYASWRLCRVLALIGALVLVGLTASAASGRGRAGQVRYVIDVFPGQLARPLAAYRVYVNGLLSKLGGQLDALLEAERSGSLSIAEADWLPAHLTWLEIGQDDGAYGAFGALGGRIDGIAGNLVGGASNPSFTGFHRVEYDLWTTNDPAQAATDTSTLIGLVDRLEALGMRRELPANVATLSAWVLRCHEILEDADRDSLTAYDNYGSGTDIASVGADVTATREMLTLLAPVIDPRAPGLVAKARRQLTAVVRAVDATAVDGRWVAVAALPTAQRERVDAAVGAALETLAPVSELIHVAGSV